jgi:hypothetical protein
METENIKSEIEELKRIKSKWSYTLMDKPRIRDLLSSISIFNHTFSVNFPNAVKHYKRNSFAEINITDGISELKMYANSDLKKKDDHYFHEGLRNVTNGIQKIIVSLESELSELE